MPPDNRPPRKAAKKKVSSVPPESPPFSATVESSQPVPFHIVGIGASAGGLAAIEAFFSVMPPHPEKGIAFVVIQHLSPDHKSLLAELIQRYTPMRVFEAEDGMELQPACVYVLPPNRDIAILRGRLQLFELDPARGIRHPIDFFLRSLAADQKERAVCIVLSGTGTDGTLGIRAIKGEGGLAIVQTPETTEFDGMPRNAIATGLVDYVLPPAEMPVQLLAYVNRIAGNESSAAQSVLKQWPDVLAKICILLRTKTSHDFSQYKESTIIRRVERRMAVHQIDRSSEYLRYLQQNGAEVSALFRDLLIGVTNFFRDPEAFAVLEKSVIPQLLERIPPDLPIRVWVCGCSTGEEAYSIAMLLDEQLQSTRQNRKIQIFATDLDRHATNQARSGIFPASIAADVSPARLARFFTQEADGAYRISKAIRDHLIFSEQDVLKDPPFSKLDLISCRNLLIYLNGDLQKRLIPLFHYALRPGGVMFLGSAESIGDQHLLFEPIDRKARLYRRKTEGQTNAPSVSDERAALTWDARAAYLPPGQGAAYSKTNFREITEQSLLSHWGSCAVLVNGRGDILYFHGRTGEFLEPAPGNVVSNILFMAREGLRRDLSAVLPRVVAKRQPISVNGLQVKANRHTVTVNLTIVPAEMPKGERSDLFVAILTEQAQVEASPAIAPESIAEGASADERVAALEHRIRTKDDYIQSVVEEMETSNEELKSSNEEMQSVNEELQSANEELETSREELQSVNEELATVNQELQQKVTDLSRSNNDMNNLLAGTGVGTLFVDHKLKISRFTPSITPILNFIETDVGRPLAHIVSNLIDYEHLIADVQRVLNTLIPFEVEVQSKAGAWYILSIRPYRTLENVIEGGVITFVDITKLKLAERALAAADHFRRAAQIETVGIAFLQTSGTITSANEAFLHMIGHKQEDLEKGKLDWLRIVPPDGMESYLKGKDELASHGRTNPYEGEYLRKDGTRGTALFATWRLNEVEIVVYTIGIPAQRLPKVLISVSGLA